MQQLKVKVKETENATWYNQKREYGKMANLKKEKYCKPCNSKTHSESECWGPCNFCGCRNHQPAYCKYKDTSNNQAASRANKATEKKKKKKTSKKAAVESSESRRDREEEFEQESSEEDSPGKSLQSRIRTHKS